MKNANTNTSNHAMKRLAWTCVLGGVLLTGIVPVASAHESGNRPVSRHTHHVVRYQPQYPRWLRRHRDFKHWYVSTRYYRQARRHDNRVAWHRLYDLYLQDRYHAYKRKRRHDYRDRGYYEPDGFRAERRRGRGRHDSD